VLYDGTIRSDDTIVVGGQNEPIVTEVRALLQPRPLAEIRTESRFEKVDEVSAASGIRSPHLNSRTRWPRAVRVVRDRDLEEVVAEVQAELADIAVDTAERRCRRQNRHARQPRGDGRRLRRRGGADRPRGGRRRRRGTSRSPRRPKTGNRRPSLGFNVDVLDDAEDRADRRT